MPAPTIRTRRTPPPEFGPALTAGREAGVRLRASTKPERHADVCEAVWRACSSLAHGDTFGSLNFLEREVVASDERTAVIAFTGSIPLLAQGTLLAVKMLERGFHLFRERATAHV